MGCACLFPRMIGELRLLLITIFIETLLQAKVLRAWVPTTSVKGEGTDGPKMMRECSLDQEFSPKRSFFSLSRANRCGVSRRMLGWW